MRGLTHAFCFMLNKIEETTTVTTEKEPITESFIEVGTYIDWVAAQLNTGNYQLDAEATRYMSNVYDTLIKSALLPDAPQSEVDALLETLQEMDQRVVDELLLSLRLNLSSYRFSDVISAHHIDIRQLAKLSVLRMTQILMIINQVVKDA